MRNDPLDSARSKFDRALAHAEVLRGAVGEYLHLAPFETETVPGEGQIVYRLRVRRTPPVRLVLIAGDAIQNARTALDHLACGLAEIETRTPARQHQRFKFPIYERKSEYLGQVRSDPFAKKVGDRARELFESIEAYGDAPLRQLHRLNIIDKHRTLFAATTAVPEMQAMLGKESITDMGHGPFLQLPHVQLSGGPLYDGDDLLVLDGDEPFEIEPRFIFDVALDEREVVRCRPLMETVDELLGEVRSVLNMFCPPVTDSGTKRDVEECMDSDELHAQRARRVTQIEEWLELEVQGRGDGTSITCVRLPDEGGVYWQIRGIEDVPVLLGVSERALDTSSGDQIVSLLRNLEALDVAIARVSDVSPGNGVLLTSKKLEPYDFTA